MAVGMGADDLDPWERARRQLKEAMVAKDAKDANELRSAVEIACAVDPNMEDIPRAKELLNNMETQFRPLTFTDIPCNEMEHLQAVQTKDAAVDCLMKCMGLRMDSGFEAEVLAEFHYNNFVFCQRSRYRTETASTLLSIMHVLHSRAIVQEKMSKEEARQLFNEFVRRHQRPLSPFCFGVFTEAEALAARQHAERGFFKHYDMYAFVYKSRSDLKVSAGAQEVALKVPKPTVLHAHFEVDPHEVAELADFFAIPEASIDETGGFQGGSMMASSVSVGSLPRAAHLTDLSPAPRPFQHIVGRGARPAASGNREIEAAIDEALDDRLNSITKRLDELPA